MPKKLKTFSFSDTAEKNLSLLMSDLEIHSASECIRYLIDAECVRRGLIKRTQCLKTLVQEKVTGQMQTQ